MHNPLTEAAPRKIEAPRIPLMAEAQRRDIGAGVRCNRLTRRSVLWALTAHQRHDDGTTYASTETLANEAGVSDRTVRRCLAELEAEGLLKRLGRRGFNTVWRIDRSVLEALPLTVQPREARSEGTGNSVRPVRKLGPPGPTEELLEESYAKHIPPYPPRGAEGRASPIGFDEGNEAQPRNSEPAPQPKRVSKANAAGPSGPAYYGRTGAPDLNPLTRNKILAGADEFEALLGLWRAADQHRRGAQADRLKALRAWRSAMRRGGDAVAILNAGREYLASAEAKRENGRFVKRLSAWLRAGCWEAIAAQAIERRRNWVLLAAHRNIAWNEFPDHAGPAPSAEETAEALREHAAGVALERAERERRLRLRATLERAA